MVLFLYGCTRLDSLDHAGTKLTQLSQAIFKWFMKSRDRRNDEDDMNEYLLTDRIRNFSRAVIGIGSGFFLTAPVAILLLGNLGQGQSLAVVGTFGALIIIILTSRGMEMEAVLLALSAYFAVLVAFLSNQQHA